MRHTQRINGVLACFDHISRRIQQLHIQHLAQVCGTPTVRPRHIGFEPHGLIFEIPHVVEVHIHFLLWHHLVKVHRFLDVGEQR